MRSGVKGQFEKVKVKEKVGRTLNEEVRWKRIRLG